MSETLDLNNLTLQDNTMACAPEGDYRFKVVSHEIGYYSGNSDKIPANTQQIICHLEVPIDGDVVVKVKHTMNVYNKALFAIRNFSECIGLCGEKGSFSFNVDAIDGKSGICKLGIKTSANGNDYNTVETTYSPSKAPTVTANDEAWKKWNDGFVSIIGELKKDGFVAANEPLPFEQ